jgi:hypothetical protein
MHAHLLIARREQQLVCDDDQPLDSNSYKAAVGHNSANIEINQPPPPYTTLPASPAGGSKMGLLAKIKQVVPWLLRVKKHKHDPHDIELGEQIPTSNSMQSTSSSTSDSNSVSSSASNFTSAATLQRANDPNSHSYTFDFPCCSPFLWKTVCRIFLGAFSLIKHTEMLVIGACVFVFIIVIVYDWTTYAHPLLHCDNSTC